MLELVMELRWLLVGAGALGLITGFVAKRVSRTAVRNLAKVY